MSGFRFNLPLTARWRIATFSLLAVILLIALDGSFSLNAPAIGQGMTPTATTTPVGTVTPSPTPTSTPSWPTAPPGLGTTASEDVGLFSEVEGDPPTSTDVETLASRLVEIDFEQLAQAIESPVGTKDPVTGKPPPPQTLVLNLFDDVVFTGIVEYVERTSSGHALWGSLDGVELGTLTLVVNGSIVVGTVRTLDAVYSIRTAGDGTYVIRQINESSLPPLGEPLEAAVSARDSHSQDDDVPPDDGTEIDVMVVYTPLAKRREGGRAAIEALIDLYVVETNQAYMNSGVIHRIRLVLREEVEYTETGDSGMDLYRLEEYMDGYMDQIHDRRDAYAADLVHILVGKSDVAGRASSAGAFGLTLSWSSGQTFAHELGHNMGLHHDRYVVGPRTGSHYGYVNQRALEPSAPESARWRTIMAYNTQCWRVRRIGCPRVPYFSNPDKTYNGDPMGVPNDHPSTGADGPADAVGTLNDRRVINANFRLRLTSPSPRAGLTLSQYWLSEDGGTSTVKATLHRVSSEDTVVILSASPSNAVTLSGNRTLTIPAGDTVSGGTVTIIGVDNDDQTGDVSLTVSATVANTSSPGVIEPEPVILVITDDDTTPVVTLSLSPAEILERGEEDEVSTFLTFTINNRSSAETTIFVSWSPASAIASTTNVPAKIPAGKLSNDGKYGLTRIYAADDNDFRGVRKIVTVSGTATNSLGITGPQSMTLTIIDDDAPLFAEDSITYTFTAGVTASRVVPQADFGNGTLTYSISPSLSNGVTFSPGPPARIGISETSLAASETSYTLTATDTEGDTDTMMVIIAVVDGVCPNSDAVSGYGNPEMDADCEALLSSRDALRGDQSLNWSEQLSIDKWQGVSIADKRVVGIDLSAVNLAGTIPSEIGNLSNLARLDLGGNKLTGSIPIELTGLANLRFLILSGNQLTGTIPAELGGLTTLHLLSLENNRLTGSIPTELGGLTGLQTLWLSNNDLTGEIPADLGGLANLRQLILGGNQLTGTIPAELNGLSQLQTLWLNNNQLTGDIPPELGDLANLGELNLSDNQLLGVIPDGLGDLANLKQLILGMNNLTDEIPAKLGNLNNLISLDISYNQLTGEIPTELGNLANLEWLSLIGNQLTGCIPTVLRNVPSNDLSALGLPFCQDTIPSPPNISEVSPAGQTGVLIVGWDAPSHERGSPIAAYDLRYVETAADETVDSNWTVVDDVWSTGSGDLQYTLTGLTADTEYEIQVRAVNAEGDGPWSATVTGTPTSSICVAGGAVEDATNTGLISDCEALLAAEDVLAMTASLNWSSETSIAQWEGVRLGGTPRRVTRLDLAGKGLSGMIPSVLGRLSMLTHLNLRSNDRLTGEIPSELGYLSNLRVLNLHSNSHSGSIPDLSGMTSLEELYLANNGLTGTVPTWLNGMTNMRELWLWGNQLEGAIPDLSGMTGLQKLKLANNMLTGGVPDGSLLPPNMTWLIIDRNPLGGTIPDLSGLKSLRLLWLHTNMLEGQIPSGDMLPPNVDDLNLRDNMLTGEIQDLSGLDTMTRLRLHNNKLSGEIPATLGDLDNLRSLWLHGNMLDGSIPASLGGLTNLERLWLSENELTGEIPEELGDLTRLTQWRLADNRITGCVPASLKDIEDSDLDKLGLPICEGGDRPSVTETFTAISSGVQHTCALLEDGTPVCWGAKLGDEGEVIGQTGFGQSEPPEGEHFVSISSGGNHTCALRADGTPVCWGAGFEEQDSSVSGPSP